MANPITPTKKPGNPWKYGKIVCFQRDKLNIVTKNARL